VLGVPSALEPPVVWWPCHSGQNTDGGRVTGGWCHSRPAWLQQGLHGQPAQTGSEQAREPGLRREDREEGREGRAALLGPATQARLARAATDAGCSSFVFQSRMLTREQDQTMARSCPQPHRHSFTAF